MLSVITVVVVALSQYLSQVPVTKGKLSLAETLTHQIN